MSCTAPRGCCSARPPACCSGSPTSRSSTSHTRTGPLFGLVSPWTLAALDLRVDRLLRLRPQPPARRAVEVIAITSVAANLAAIIGGILVFGEPIGPAPLAISARLLAFCLVIAGAALMPAPMRATPDAASRPSRGPARATRRNARRPIALALPDERAYGRPSGEARSGRGRARASRRLRRALRWQKRKRRELITRACLRVLALPGSGNRSMLAGWPHPCATSASGA